VPHGLGERLFGVAPDAALHRHEALEADVPERREGAGKVRVSRPGLEAAAVGEVDVGEAVARRPDGPAEVVLLDVHVEEVAHDLHGGAAHGFAVLVRPFHAVQHVVLVAVQGFEEDERTLPLGVLTEFLQRVEEDAPVLRIRARHVKGGSLFEARP
jgi:hypothetical protein